MNISRILIAIAAIFLITASVYANNQQEQTVQNVQIEQNDTDVTYSGRASSKFMNLDLNGAIDDLNKAISVNPSNPWHYLNRGYVKHVMQDLNGAMEDYNKALSINGSFAYAYNNRGVLKVTLNDTEGAMADYERALKLNKKYADVYYNRANLKYMLDDNEGALADYDLAIKYNPKDSDAYNNRGVVKKRMNLNIGALSDYSQAIQLNPKDSIAYANRGRLKKLYFDNEGASVDLDKAVALAENQVFIKNVKPLLSNQHYIAAIPSVKSLIETPSYIGPKPNPNQDNNLAYNTTQQSKTDIKPTNEKQKLSKTDGEKIAMSVPNAIKTVSQQNKSVTKKSGTATLNAGVGKVKLLESPDIRTSAVESKPTTNVKLAESYYIRGLQKCILHDLQGAVADLDKAIANNSKYADAYFYRGAIRKELGDIEGFRADYTEAIKINPSLQTYDENNALALIK